MPKAKITKPSSWSIQEVAIEQTAVSEPRKQEVSSWQTPVTRIPDKEVAPIDLNAGNISVPTWSVGNIGSKKYIQWKDGVFTVRGIIRQILELTAGETINGATTPVAVYVDQSDNEVYACDADDPDKLVFAGFAITNSTDGNKIQIQSSSVVGGFSGLTEGKYYYVQDDKTIGETPGTYVVQVGLAVSATELLILYKPAESIGASDTLQTSADTERSISEASYTKKKEIQYNEIDGTIRVKFDIKDNNGAGITYGRIYVNGIAVGTERSESAAVYTTFSEDITVENGDLVQLYNKTNTGGGGSGGVTRNFRIYYTKGLAALPNTVNTD